MTKQRFGVDVRPSASVILIPAACFVLRFGEKFSSGRRDDGKRRQPPQKTLRGAEQRERETKGSALSSQLGRPRVTRVFYGDGSTNHLLCVCAQVLEEREKLKQDRDIRMKKKEYLMKELERLRKQQGGFTHTASTLGSEGEENPEHI